MKKLIVILVCFFVFCLSVFLIARFVGTSGLKIKEYMISENVTDNFNGLKIVHFTDIHYGMTTGYEDLKEIVDKINFIKPDVIIFTGDFEDSVNSITTEEKERIINVLKELKCTLGKYAVNGNHDSQIFEEVMTRSGFTLLNNSYELIYNKDNSPILIAGVSSNILDTTSMDDKLLSVYEYINSVEIGFKILLMHEPDFIDNVKTDYFNLVLAGHSHGGQIKLPIFGSVIKAFGAKKYDEDYYKVNNMDLYISSGIGTSKIKLRLFNKPSINFYRIVN